MSYRLLSPPARDEASSAPIGPVPGQGLSPEQERVVGHRAGPLLVLGGPGSGKTTTMVEAVAARVAEGVPPDRVLVLTFGRRAAGALRHRIESRVGHTGHTMAEPLVRTFHAYAFGLLRRFAAEAGDPAPRLLTGPEQDLVLRELLRDADPGWPDGLRPALRTRAFAEQLRDLLLRCAERGVPPSELARLGQTGRRADWVAAAHFMVEYEEVMALRDTTARAGAGYDAAELVRAASTLLRDEPELLAAERRRLSTVYVDELADTDPAQVELLGLIAGDGGHLVAFADPDSSTFAFRGADPGVVHRFPDLFPTLTGGPTPTIVLPATYRFGPALLSATARVSNRVRGPVRHRLQFSAVESPSAAASPAPGGADRQAAVAIPAPGGAGRHGAAGDESDRSGRAEVHTFRSSTSEAAYVAHRLREAHLLGGVPWDRMAVVVRSSSLLLATLSRALQQAGVPVVTLAEDLPLPSQPAVLALLLALRCALEPDQLDEESAVTLLHSPLGGADPMAERRLRQGLRALALAGGDRRPSGALLVEALRDPRELAAVERRWSAPARRLAGLLAAVREAAGRPGATAEDTLWALWQTSGLAERWMTASARGGARGAAADRDLDAVMVLFDAAIHFVDRLPGARTEVFLDYVLGQELPGDTLAATADRGPAVRILTAHAAKGLEWELVIVPGVQEGVWPDLRLRGSVLGSEHLVDLLAGRELNALGQSSALLDEERRLFYVAVTRARRQLIVTAVASGDGEEQPSRFLHEIGAPPDDEAPSATRLPRALTLPALVAELRAALVEEHTSEGRRTDAATQLARLAEAGVPGADPAEWWGLLPLSDDRPLSDDGEPVTVTPSTVESVQRCSLRWLLERHGGSAAATPEQGVGNLVHAAAMLATGAFVDRTELIEYVSARFDEIELSARWMAGRERDRAEHMIDKLVGWLAANPRRLAAIEKEFLVQLDEVTRIKGRVDRLEIDEHGRLVVIDLKTGKTTSVTESELPEQPQLGAYQAAVEAGGFPEFGFEAGGAALVQLGTNVNAKEQAQAPLSEAGDAGWAADLVRRTASTMAAATFQAVANSKCRSCPVRTSCPVSGRGRQVTGEVDLPTQRDGDDS